MFALRRYLPLALLPALLLAGCGGVHLARQVGKRTAAGNYADALALLDKGQWEYAGPSSLLFYFDRGALLQRMGQYAASNAELEQADLLIEQLYGISIAETAVSMLVNDMSMAYTGEDFEQVMVNVLKELNYLFAGNLDGALVEARKVNTRLTSLADKYGAEAVYRQDAFASYLAAFAYEADGDYNNAYIDYKQSYEAYRAYEKAYGFAVPEQARYDLLRLARWMGDEEYRQWREALGQDMPEPPARLKPQSEVMLVVFDGLVSEKYNRYTPVPTTDPDGHPYTLNVAFPVFLVKPPAIDRVRVGTPDGRVVETEVLEPLNQIAVQNLDQRIGAISAKAIARALLKYTAAVQARRALRSENRGANLLVDLATNIFTFASEQADTRSWRTLPNRFQAARLALPPGKHTLEVRVVSLDGGDRPGFGLDVEVKPGEKKVVPLFLPN